MTRRRFIQCGLAAGMTAPVVAALKRERLEEAAERLERVTRSGQVAVAVLHVVHRDSSFTRFFGGARGEDAMFLLGSISKPIAMAALMTLFEKHEFKLTDPLQRFIPNFTGGGREQVTLLHLLTHRSGLPDQLAENDELRSRHASLDQFVDHAVRAPLGFAPGANYRYSSMGILLAARVAELIAGTDIPALIDRAVFQPLEMRRSAQGIGRFGLEEMVPVQVEHAAPEAGGGNPNARDWDWNSPWWRKLGAPWGGTHSSAPDLAKFLNEFLREKGACLKPETARLMIRNHNPPGMTPRGLGFALGPSAGSTGCSERVFGHTGSTGTLAWADPATELLCVVLTSLPARAVQPHPRDLAANAVAAQFR